MIDNLVIEHENGWLQVKVPLPYSLKWVNAYLLPGEGEGDWSLIDPGLHTGEAENVWLAVMQSRGIAWDGIARIVLTHHHPDHYGLAGWFQERTGAPVWMSRKAHETARWMWGRDREGDEGGKGREGSKSSEDNEGGEGRKDCKGNHVSEGGKEGREYSEGSSGGGERGDDNEGGGGCDFGGEHSGANVVGSSLGGEGSEDYVGGEVSEGCIGGEHGEGSVTDVLLASFLAHGLPASLADEMKTHLLGFVERVSPQPASVSYLRPGSTFQMAGIQWQLIGGEGHAPGHLSFYDPVGGRILCGDQVLPDISPNIGWLPGSDPDPLGSFLDSLSAMRHLEVTCAYPGHRQPFCRFGERVDELMDHHERRLERIAELIRERPSASFDVCERLFGERLRGNVHNLRFALSETIAHLVLLERRGAIQLADGNLWVSRK